MSELINNRAERREKLKQIIRELHAGATPEEQKEKFKELIKDTGPTEIAELEQELIKEGLPETEIKRLCDVHVAVFKETLNEQQRPDEIPGHPVHTFKKENRAVEAVVQELRPIVVELQKEGPDPELLSKWQQHQQALLQLDRHYSRKENILFPYLEKHGISGPPSVMWAIHDDIRALLKQVVKTLAEPPKTAEALGEFINATALPVLTAIDDMIYKEENILFPMCMDTLTEEEWGAIQSQGSEIGYCLVEPDQGWQPGQGKAEPVETGSTPQGQLKFKTGILTLEEISLIFDHLPVDITYVDKDNRVKYFSAAKERIFPRTPAIIGRTVQNCHPPDSVHVVNKIVDEFKQGRRDVADFWIRMNGMLLYIRYFAVRNEAGEYLGTLEVTQNVTDIKKLEGEKRILDHLS